MSFKKAARSQLLVKVLFLLVTMVKDFVVNVKLLNLLHMLKLYPSMMSLHLMCILYRFLNLPLYVRCLQRIVVRY